MWKINYAKMEDRTPAEWLSIIECIAVYMNQSTYTYEDVILGMLGIEKETPAEAEED